MAYQVYQNGKKYGDPFEKKSQAVRFARSIISFHGFKSATIEIKRVK